MVFFSEFIMRWLQNLKNFGTIEVNNKYVENEEYSKIHLLSPTCTSLDNFLFFKWLYIYTYIYNLFECILYMRLINIIVIKLKIIRMLIIKLKNISTFNTLKLVYV
jgi:hypothetical protein